MRLLGFILSALFIASCTNSGSDGGSSAITYKYQISGVSAMAVSSDSVSALATNFILKWNEDVSGNITGIYTNQSTGQAINITGTSNGSGRTITGTLTTPIGSATSVRFIIAQTGDLNGSYPATVETLDVNNAVVTTQSISVSAETTITSGGGGGGGTPPTIWDSYGKISCWTARQNTSNDTSPATVVIDKNGDVYGWGQNSNKRLGLPSNQIYSTPTKLTFPGTPGKITYVTIGNSQGAAIDENNKLYGWGYFTYPTNASNVDSITEITLPGTIVPRQIHLGKSNMFIIDTNGKVWAVGGDTFGQMGTGVGDGVSTTFIDTGITGVTQMVTAHNDDTIHILKSNGTVWGWGQGNGYRFENSAQTNKDTPFEMFGGLTGFTHISRDYGAFMAVNSNGKVYTWGNQSSPRGKLGRKTVMSQGPTTTEGFARIADVAHTAFSAATQLTTGMNELVYIVGTDGKWYRWGANLFGDGFGGVVDAAAGTDVIEVANSPTDVEALKGCGDMIYAVKSDGTLQGAGSQTSGAIGNGQNSVTNALTFVTIGTLDLKD